MSWLCQLVLDTRQRFRYLFRRGRLQDELNEELEFHLEMRRRQRAEAGEADTDAQFAARRQFGNTSVISAVTQEMWRYGTLESLWQDIRYAWRYALRTPGITAVAVLSLALGIGANAGIFALVDRVILSILPVKDPQQLVLLDDSLAYLRYQEFSDRSQVFNGVAGTASLANVRLDESDNPESSVSGRLVSGNYFDVLGVRPLLGRALSPSDDTSAGAHPNVVISYALWQARFHGDPEIVGKTIRLGTGKLSSGWGSGGFEEDQPVTPSNRDFVIVGVTQPNFFGETVGERPVFWAPLTMEEHFLPGRHWLTRRTAQWVRVIARLRPGVTLQQAEAASRVLYRQLVLKDEGPGLTEARRRDIEQQKISLVEGGKGFSNLREDFAKPLWVLMAMVGAVLLIACANLANLLLARGAARRREIGTRLALGVDRVRLLRQLITESLLLSFAGAVLSVPIGTALTHILFSAVSSGNANLEMDLAPDFRVLLFTGVVAIGTTLLFGLVPAIRSTRLDISTVLKETTRSAAVVRHVFAGEKVAVVLQVALSATLLFGAGLFTQTLYHLKSQDLGYVPDNLITANIDPTAAGYKGDDLGRISQRILEEIRRLPGVSKATYSDNGLFAGKDSGTQVRFEGFKPGSREDAVCRFDQVGPGYFAALGIPILLGRDIADSDTPNAPRVAVINQSMAKFYFGDRNPVGQTLYYEGNRVHFTLTIVGVVRDVRDHGLRRDVPRRFYVAYQQPVDGQMGADLEVRTPLAPAVVEKEIRRTIRAISPQMPVDFVRPLSKAIDDSILTERLIAGLSVFFGGLALLLGCIGLYGILAYSVARRTPEIGIRIAIGASPADVVRAVVWDAFVLVAIGLAIGVPTALALSRYLQSLLFGLKAMDGWSLCLVVSAMLVMALVASAIPAGRAARIDPVLALRAE
ncbi:MAG: ABC transporter permease [Bryobacteraceae bacterium]